ncbi:CRISPR-associated endonuclease Cas3'' [Methylomagnum sp.]
MDNLDQYEFWAKTTDEGLPGISVLHHMLNVGHVARLIADQRKEALAWFNLNPSAVAVMAALHDIGKISQGFQSKCPAWLDQNGLAQTSTIQGWQNLEKDHAKVSQFTIEGLLFDSRQIKPKSAIHWAVVAGSHHGYLHRPGERGLDKSPGMSKDTNAQGDAAWEAKRRQVAQQLVEILGGSPRTDIGPDSPELWWLTGLISVADWIGSDENYFPSEADSRFTTDASRERAEQAVEKIGLAHPTPRRGLDFAEISVFPPTICKAKPSRPSPNRAFTSSKPPWAWARPRRPSPVPTGS